MTHLEEIVREIEKIRVLIYQLINENEALTDQKLVVLSQKLDELINEYDKLLN
ncbi:aspartyl-phosphate phosphatase Spo0E family protein [uncultured Clostridium sp.]|uniref:aspartyl-phosphate phosphatase Spo0E family protein n=1 Tax=uncultured Clostridium sp. TaxID=59620 RepID=UPI00260F9C1E|nr:aspartyl-phosphate phosphatase Spo0E family protein [uncultured Clostridium sp.]